MVPPRGRMPRTSWHVRAARLSSSSGPRQPSRIADELVAVASDALADDRADHRVQPGAVAAAGEHSDPHATQL